MKITVQAPANIAFIKYWGKPALRARLPQNSSLSMCLDSMFTVTSVETDATLVKDEVTFVGERKALARETARIVRALAEVRKLAGSRLYARVATRNNFTKSTGIVSS